MSVVAAAIIGSAVVAAGTAVYVNETQKDAARDAAKTQKNISDESLALQKELADTQRQDFAPWRQAGEKALTQIQEGIKTGAFDPGAFDPSKIDVTKDPGYKFRMQQGLNALESSAASRGMTLSGAQLKDTQDYAQGLASQEYGNAYARGIGEYQLESDRRARKFNILAGLSGQGQASAAGQAGATNQLAGTSANILNNLGNAQAQSQYAQGQAQANMYNTMGQTANQAAQNWLLYQSLKPASAPVPSMTTAPVIGNA